ncbi:MAG: HD domain-containing protein [Lachnospiraceae bacterium]|nr:HD domain-containing protein [Lachnospiraceae bacterium]
MINIYYLLMFIVSIICTGIYICRWHKHFEIYYSLMYAFVPIVNMAYMCLAYSSNLEEALLANKFSYIGGVFFPLLITLAIISICKIKLRRRFVLLCMLVSGLLYACILTTGYTDIYYKSVGYKVVDGIVVLEKEYAFVHNMHYIVLAGYMIAGVIVLIYSKYNRRNISTRTMYLFLIVEFLSIVSYILGRVIPIKITWMPLAYVGIQIVFLFIISRIYLYDVNDVAVDNIVQNGETAIISFDMKKLYLGCNKTAEKYFPELNDIKVDRPINNKHKFFENILEWIDELDREGDKIEKIFEKEDLTFKVKVEYLKDGVRKKGYQIMVVDDTSQQQYISLLNNYNSNLKKEVEKKVDHIQHMQDKMILSFADMVENRDNSTGGHIKRTSHVVRILLNEMRKDEECGITNEFYQNVIKAAPMHDLGKIAVEDVILRKPGKFTAEEFECMKQHASKGADIVKSVLEGIEDEEFRRVAKNVAHYHHERWDGSGYPEKLSGESIPLEARIMAIADVYDALVSKRCYKERMSFEEANNIIKEGMGKHFDASLYKYFLGCREELEEYYMKYLED